MSEEPLGRLASRLKRLDEGAYERTYLSRGRMRGTATHHLVASLLDSLGLRYRENVMVPGRGGLTADFVVNGRWVFVEKQLVEEERKALSARGLKVVVIGRETLRSDRLDHGLRIIGLGEEGRQQTIFLDDPSFNFDYAHILPKTEKCSVMHGHTSSVLVEVVGRPVDGMVVDFAVAKKRVRQAVRGLDHKLFINERYVSQVDPRSVTLRFDTVHGEFAIRAPRGTTVMMKGEATVENLAKEVLQRIAPKMPGNVTSVGVYVYEGLNKGSHILARLHQGGVGGRRKKQ